MKSYPLLLFIMVFEANYSELEEAFSKTICSMRRISETDFYFSAELSLNQIRLSKELFQKCNFRVRMISDLHALRNNDLVIFAYNENDIKVFQV